MWEGLIIWISPAPPSSQARAPPSSLVSNAIKRLPTVVSAPRRCPATLVRELDMGRLYWPSTVLDSQAPQTPSTPMGNDGILRKPPAPSGSRLPVEYSANRSVCPHPTSHVQALARSHHAPSFLYSRQSRQQYRSRSGNKTLLPGVLRHARDPCVFWVSQIIAADTGTERDAEVKAGGLRARRGGQGVAHSRRPQQQLARKET